MYSAGEEATKIGDQESLPKVKEISTIEEGSLYIYAPVKYGAPNPKMADHLLGLQLAAYSWPN